MIKLKSPWEIEKMRVAGQVVARTLEALEKFILPGVTTLDVDRRAEELLKEQGAVSSFKGYRGYPNTVCIAVNEEVVHGIPSDERVIRSGDIVGIDIGAIVDGYHGDSALTVPVGDVTHDARLLLKVTREALFTGIAEARVGNRLSNIGHAIQVYAEKHGYSVVRDLVGHGIGSDMHEDPQVPNFGKAGGGVKLQEGMTLAIEPMVNAGTFEVISLDDRWTIVTADGRLSAHFEHTVAVTANGPDILTLRSEEGARL